MYFEDFMSKFTELPIACYVSRRTGEDMASGRWYKRHLHRNSRCCIWNPATESLPSTGNPCPSTQER